MDDQQSDLKPASSILNNGSQATNQPINRPAESPSKTTQSGKKIFIVEDQKEYRDILVEILNKEGFTTLQAENGQEALDIMKTADCDLILLDMLMPRMDGTTFLYHLRNTLNKKNIPVIILTNFTEAAYPEGVIDYIVKTNISLDELVKKIRSYI